MILCIGETIRRQSETFDSEFQEKFPDQDFNGRKIVFEDPVGVTCRYSYDGKTLNIEGTISVGLRSQCARCNADFLEKLEIPFSEKYVNLKYSEEFDEDCYSFSGNQIDLDGMVMDNVFLNLPIVSFCRKDCKGLCPVCGCNLNEKECGCER